MEVVKIEVDNIPLEKLVKMTDMGHIKEIMSMDKVCFSGPGVTKIDRDFYMINETGEIKSYKHTDNRSQGIDSLRRTFKKIRHIINYNFHGDENELAFTLTYVENMTDVKQLYKDFERFFKRLRYRYGKNIDYFSVVEPQGRGAWHCHVLLKFNSLDKIYIPNAEIARIWGKGFVSVKAIKKDIDNLGAYLSAYLGDIELTGENMRIVSECCPGGVEHYEVKEIDVDGNKKRFIKGGRLYLYPTGMNIYRKSRGIKVPKDSWVRYSEVKKIVGSATPNYSSMVYILDDKDLEINRIIYEQYNLKRLDSQDK
uniref:Replication-associated protein ORF2/G2P domain-containing protein n=1 Tax=uncultured prokaryote TaxID=198431 RepID=A0A0H5Q333_9ZZZZ|nr:hypothetical protein [uncultured prokaryote]